MVTHVFTWVSTPVGALYLEDGGYGAVEPPPKMVNLDPLLVMM